MEKIKLLDKEFSISIPSENISKTVDRIAGNINVDLAGEQVIFLGILNGAFMFASDLIRKIGFPAQISFLKLASYQGTINTQTVKRLIGINEDIKGKVIVILEDIVDSGLTIDNIVKQLKGYEPASVKIATLLFKPGAYIKDIPLDYVGFEIPNSFVVGYGLDYKGYGRNLDSIYSLI